MPIVGEPNLLAYSVSKGALMTPMTRNLGGYAAPGKSRARQPDQPGWVLTEQEIIRKERMVWMTTGTKTCRQCSPLLARILFPEEIAAAAVYWLSDESGPISGQVVDWEQHPFIGRNPPKDETTIPANK